MKLLMLSGNSLRNRDWIYEVKDQFSKLIDDVYIQDYAHWANGNEWIDISHELDVIGQQDFGDDYAVFAKSIGTVLTMQAVEQGLIRPKFLLLCGLPLDFIKSEYKQFSSVLADYNGPVTIIHNSYDKVGSAEAVREYLRPILVGHDITFIETPGDTHNYEDYYLLRAQLKLLIRAS